MRLRLLLLLLLLCSFACSVGGMLSCETLSSSCHSLLAARTARDRMHVRVHVTPGIRRP
jgi:hypothetical protein